MIIIGVTGSIGAGKGTIVSYLKKKGFKHYSVRAFITEEIRRRKMPVNRESMVSVANDMRTKHSPSYLIERIYERALKNNKDCVIESIRTPGEVEWLKKQENFTLFAVDADQKLRYERIKKRKSSTDMISFEEFMMQEEKEMKNNDKNMQNIGQCMSMANYRFINNNKKEELFKNVENTLNSLKKD